MNVITHNSRVCVGKLCAILMALFLPVIAFAQNITVKGTVTDELDSPVISATVVVVGQTNKGALTDLDGNFTISDIPANSTLRISYIGYKTQEIALNGRTTLAVKLVPDSELLDEVVVTALGIKRSQKALSYNVQEVKGDALNTVKDANFMNSLSGKVAGVNINASSAGVGGATRVVMRGPKSINASNQALYVVDGIPLFNENKGEVDGILVSQPSGEGISDINPDDIESLSVLSGASAAALYGSAAANGVIMITTKKGREGALRLSISNNSSFMTPVMLPRFQSSYVNNLGQSRSWGKKATDPSSIMDPAKFFRTGTNIQNTVSLTIGGEKSQTYLSLGTTNANGILPNSGYNRYNVTARNTSTFMDDKLTLDLSANYILSNDKNLMAQGQYFNPLPALYLFPRGESFEGVRTFEIYDPARMIYVQNWAYGDAFNMQNPYWMLNRMVRTNVRERYMLAGSLSYRPLEWLTIVGRVRYDNSHNKEKTSVTHLRLPFSLTLSMATTAMITASVRRSMGT